MRWPMWPRSNSVASAQDDGEGGAEHLGADQDGGADHGEHVEPDDAAAMALMRRSLARRRNQAESGR